MPAESFEGAQTVWLNAAGRTVRRPPVARSIRCRIIRASQAAFGRSACGESRIPVPKLRPTDAPKNRTVRGKRDGCRNGPSPCGPCYRDAAPPLVRNCTGETSSALLSQQAHDTGPADRSGMTKRSPPPIVGTFGVVDPCDIGPCIRCGPHIGPGRIFGDRRRRPFARLLIRYARRHVSGHRSRSRVECPLCNRCAGRRGLRSHPFGLRAAL